ncbi:hypothetical protein C5167_044700 [Papaver somniferum]|nr:hypothetical protein C5167_044700 [Papaver somniferum]
MYLQYYINDNGDKVYTVKLSYCFGVWVLSKIEFGYVLEKESPLGKATESAHPARFSPDDKYSRQRVLLKKRFGLLPTQKPAPKY